MKAAQFDYKNPRTLDDALKLMSQADTKAISGGQSLGPMLNLRLTRPAQIIDISGLAELRSVHRRGDTIEIGAAVTHADIEDGVHEALRDHPLQSAAQGIAYRSVRNRGTVGGSLAHADPAADWVIVMAGLGAQLVVASVRGQRELPMSTFMSGAYTTELAADELITAVRVPALTATARWGYYKFCRKPGEFAEASAVIYLDPASRIARVVLGALDGPPRSVPELASQIAAGGPGLNDAEIRKAVDAALPEHDAISRQWQAAAVRRAVNAAFPEANAARLSGETS